MDVIFGHHRHVEVHHVTQFGDVDAARGDVGRDEDAEFPALEVLQGTRALRLRAIAVDAIGRDVVLSQVCRKAVGTCLGARENDRAVDVVVFEQLDEQVVLLHLTDGVEGLRDADRRVSLAGGGGRRAPDRAASRRTAFAISAGIVAEKKSVCRLVGTRRRMRRTVGRKPMSSMRSASSRTRNEMLSSEAVFCAM